MAQSYTAKSMFSEALDANAHHMELSHNSPFALALDGNIRARMGDRKTAKRVLDALTEKSKKTYVPGMAVAVVYIGLGDKERSLGMAEQGLRRAVYADGVCAAGSILVSAAVRREICGADQEDGISGMQAETNRSRRVRRRAELAQMCRTSTPLAQSVHNSLILLTVIELSDASANDVARRQCVEIRAARAPEISSRTPSMGGLLFGLRSFNCVPVPG